MARRTNSAFFKAIIVLNCWLVTLTIVNGARILAIFPMAAKSHFSCNEAMMRSLYNAGHQITFVSPFPNDESVKNYTAIDTKRDSVIYIGQSSLKEFTDMSIYKIMSLITEIEVQYCKDVLDSKEIQDLMNSNEKLYDVMFIELLSMFQCFLPLAEKLGIPVIGTVTLRSWKYADAVMGNPNNPSVIPGEFTHFSDQMSFTKRLNNIWMSLFLDYHFNHIISSKLNDINEKYYSSDLLDKKRISLVFTNNHFSLLSRSTIPNVIDVGGIHVQPAKALQRDYKKFLDEAEHGVILFSLGSVMKSSTMDAGMTNAFREAFAEIPQRVIWKFEDSLENLTDNVMLTKWMPQRDILTHKNVKAFISHCGMSGSYEALTEGVPMIFTPLFGDQISNAALLERLGVGIYLDIFSVTKEKVLNALNTVVNDTKYRDTMKEVSTRFTDRPMTPQQSIVYWTEYVIRHKGASYMRPVAADMPFYKYFLLDAISFAAVIIIVSSYLILKLVNGMYNYVGEKSKYRYSVLVEINKKNL